MAPLPANKKLLALGLLTLLALLAYSNTFEASWHLDDYPNIVHNSRAHLRDLHLDSVVRALYIGDGTQALLNRPVARLTLALNWFAGQGKTFGFHLVNLGLHVMTAYLLFVTVGTLFGSPRLKGEDPSTVYAVALFGSILWALNPVQTQAVTYIVQRMAILAALFYVAGLLCYLKGRLATGKKQPIGWFLGCLLCFLGALGSKENAIMLPAALVLAEIIFFQDLSNRDNRRKLWVSAVSVGLGLAIIGLLILQQRGSIKTLFDAYEIRGFSLAERLLTQPRILVFYLSQLFYPLPSRLSIEHDFVVSTGLLTPWTTLPALAAILALLGLGLAQMRRRPLLSFALLFFFLNHLIESSIFPLELVFEHRNYLPSMFLFVPVAGLLQLGLDHYRTYQRQIYALLAASIPILIMTLGMGTYVRNAAWANEKTLWQDAQFKAPDAARPYYNLAKHYYKKNGRLKEALAFYQKSFKGVAAFPEHSRALALNGMAGIYYLQKDYHRVIALCREALRHRHEFVSAWHNMALAGIQLGQWETAMQALAHLAPDGAIRQPYTNWKALIYLRQADFSRAYAVLQNALKHNAHDSTTNLYFGAASGLTGHVQQGEWFLQRALALTANQTWPLLLLIENRMAAEDRSGVRRYLKQLMHIHSIKEIHAAVEQSTVNHFRPPLNRDKLYRALADELARQADAFAKPTGRQDGNKT